MPPFGDAGQVVDDVIIIINSFNYMAFTNVTLLPVAQHNITSLCHLSAMQVRIEKEKDVRADKVP